jgi:hypothetical protein
VARQMVVAEAKSAENPPMGRRCGVMREPMVLTMRQPLALVPMAIAA